MKAKTLVATLMGALSFAAMAGELDTPSTIARPAGVEAAPAGVLVKKNEAGVIVEAYKVPVEAGLNKDNVASQAQSDAAVAAIISNPANKITLNNAGELDQSTSAASSWYIGWGYGIGYGYGWGGYYGGYCGYPYYGYGYGCGYGGYWGGYYGYYRPYGCWGWYW